LISGRRESSSGNARKHKQDSKKRTRRNLYFAESRAVRVPLALH
jgi:hypothetical protein